MLVLRDRFARCVEVPPLGLVALLTLASACAPTTGAGPLGPAAPLAPNASEVEEAASAECPQGMAHLPGGSFEMGERGDTVTVQPFCMDLTEVTVAAYRQCVTRGECSTDDLTARTGVACNWGALDREQHPLNCVDWYQASAYCRAQGKRLPTEEEWEWAARGGAEGRIYPWGNAAPGAQACWSGVSKRGGACPVASYPEGRSTHGLHDMAGNVWEWTESSAGANEHITRGGSWFHWTVDVFRVSSRNWIATASRSVDLGFRCAQEE